MEQLQPFLVKLLNNGLIRRYIGLYDELRGKKVVRVGDNGYHVVNGNKIEFVGRCYPLIHSKLSEAIKIGGLVVGGLAMPSGAIPIFLGTKTAYSAAGDGWVQGSGVSWDTTHDAVSGGFITNYTNTTALVGSGESSGYYISRLALPFDSSSIPDRASIQTATVKVVCNQKGNTDNDGDDWLNIVNTTTASDTALVSTDYNDIGDSIDDPTEGATRIDFGSIGVGSTTTFTLNATGRGWINKSGYSKLGLREGHDCLDNVIGDELSDELYIRTSEYTGTSSDPLLTVTYIITLNQGIII